MSHTAGLLICYSTTAMLHLVQHEGNIVAGLNIVEANMTVKMVDVKKRNASQCQIRIGAGFGSWKNKATSFLSFLTCPPIPCAKI